MSNADNYKGGSFVGDDLFLVDGDQSLAEPVGIPRISFPMEGDSHNSAAPQVAELPATADDYQVDVPKAAENDCPSCFLIEQEFKCSADWFEPLALNTVYDTSFAHDYVGSLDLGSAILIAEGPQQDIGGGFVKWTRTYCYMNFNQTGNYVRNEYESIPFTFPALGADTVNDTPFAPAFSDEVEARVEHIYFIFDGSNSPERLFEFYPFLSANGPSYQQPDNTVTADGSSSPSLADYTSWVDNGYEIVVRASCLRRWRGNIFELVTYFAPAE